MPRAMPLTTTTPAEANPRHSSRVISRPYSLGARVPTTPTEAYPAASGDPLT